jgi:hypothetical protein
VILLTPSEYSTFAGNLFPGAKGLKPLIRQPIQECPGAARGYILAFESGSQFERLSKLVPVLCTLPYLSTCSNPLCRLMAHVDIAVPEGIPRAKS